MPGLDGLQATLRIRARERAAGGPRLPIVAMTARAMTEDRDRCRAAGMDGFLAKPLDQQELFDLLEEVGRQGHLDRPGQLDALLTHVEADIEEVLASLRSA